MKSKRIAGARGACQGKLKYASRGEARLAARRAREKDPRNPYVIREYACGACRWWHIGHGEKERHR